MMNGKMKRHGLVFTALLVLVSMCLATALASEKLVLPQFGELLGIDLLLASFIDSPSFPGERTYCEKYGSISVDQMSVFIDHMEDCDFKIAEVQSNEDESELTIFFEHGTDAAAPSVVMILHEEGTDLYYDRFSTKLYFTDKGNDGDAKRAVMSLANAPEPIDGYALEQWLKAQGMTALPSFSSAAYSILPPSSFNIDTLCVEEYVDVTIAAVNAHIRNVKEYGIDPIIVVDKDNSDLYSISYIVNGNDYSIIFDNQQHTVELSRPSNIEPVYLLSLDELLALRYEHAEKSEDRYLSSMAMPGFATTSAQKNPDRQGLTSNGYFEGKEHWVEIFDKISQEKVSDYVRAMQLYGFDVLYMKDDTSGIYLFTKDEARILLTCGDGTVFVEYQPGIDYYILEGQELLNEYHN